MTIKQLINSIDICLSGTNKCDECIFFSKVQCKFQLAEEIKYKFNELTSLLDDKVNHHYYDTLEFYQEENTKLREQLGGNFHGKD